jgi:hypothetical protein
MPTSAERVTVLARNDVASPSAWMRTVVPAIASQIGNSPSE